MGSEESVEFKQSEMILRKCSGKNKLKEIQRVEKKKKKTVESAQAK